MENEIKKIKVQKRTPSEKQLESLEKARLSKQKKKVIKEHQDSTSFLYPPPYMTGLILLGFGGLAAYSFLKEQKNSQITEQNLPLNQVQESILMTSIVPEAIQTEVIKTINKTKDFFSGSTTI